MRQYVPELMPLIVEALLDGSAIKREVGVATLGQLVQSTGYVIDFFRIVLVGICGYFYQEIKLCNHI